MKAIHLICHEEGNGLRGLEPAPEGKNVWMSYPWAFHSRYDLKSLEGGWLYLHSEKAVPSRFGGIIEEIVDSARPDKAQKEGFMIIFEARKEARDVKWRGTKHKNDWTGGIVEADYKHEVRDENAKRPLR